MDEAGCGCLAGPVVAAALHLPADHRIGGIRDSKQLSRQQRERIVAALRARGAVWAIGNATPQEIDRLNIRRATYLAMGRAVRALLALGITDQGSRGTLSPFALVDAWTIPNIPILQRAIVHGDRLVRSIAAASIVAKVTRDAMMAEFDRRYPLYCFAVHKGYATAAHRAAIAAYGLSPIHRRTFCKGL